MNKLKNVIEKFFLLSLLLFSAVELIGEDNFANTENANIDIIYSEDFLKEGDELILGLRFKLTPGWHIYWKNPGDSGLPPELEWNLPVGIEFQEILWPSPELAPLDPLTSYGYYDEVVLPIKFKINSNYNYSEKFSAFLSFLICEEICIPEDTNISIDLTKFSQSQLENGKNILNDWINRLPSKSSFITEAFLSDNTFKISWRSGEIYEKAYFYPEQNGLINYSSNQILGKNNESAYLTIDRPENFREELQFVSGVLELQNADQKTFFQIENSIERVSFIEVNKTQGLSFLLAIFLAFIGGIILNAMPCVFPILSIKLMSIINTNKNEARYSFFITSIGIIFSYMLLAIIFLILKKINIEISWGMQFQQPYFLMFISLVISIFALNMFNVFEFKLPQFILSSNFVNIGKGKFTKNFFNGFFATLLATPCSAPFVGTAITAAFTQSSLVMIGIFLFMGIGMSIPYLLVSIFPSVINFIPKPGKWMIYIRYFLGILLLLTLIWLFNILLSFFNYYFIFISIVLLIFSIYFFKIKYYNFSAVVIFVIIFFLLPSVDNLKQKTSDSVDKDWIDFFTIKIEDLINDNNIIFLDITADWCATCQFNKVNVINKNDILDLFKKNNIMLVKADWTKPDKRINEFLNEYSKFGIPFNAFYSKNYPDGVVLSELLSKEEIINTIKIIKN